jgi:hypothetical protein
VKWSGDGAGLVHTESETKRCRQADNQHHNNHFTWGVRAHLAHFKWGEQAEIKNIQACSDNNIVIEIKYKRLMLVIIALNL